MRVLIEAKKKLPFSGNLGTAVIETIGIFSQLIPPMVMLEGEKHLYGWFRRKMPADWTTAVSPNGWTDATLGCARPQINFEPHTRPPDPDQWRLLILDVHGSHIIWQLIQFALAHRIIYVCLPPYQLALAAFRFRVFSPFTSEFSKVYEPFPRIQFVELITGPLMISPGKATLELTRSCLWNFPKLLGKRP